MNIIEWICNDKNGPRWWLQRLTEWKFRICPRQFDLAVRHMKSMKCAEVGVFEGWHAETMLKNLDIQTLYLVDQYKGYSDYNQMEMDTAKKKAKDLLSKFPSAVFIYLESTEASRQMPPLDFCYIDAAHDYESVKSDISAWWPTIKPGGILGGHDFDNGGHVEHDGVVRAVTEFSVSNNLSLMVRSPDWWIVKP